MPTPELAVTQEDRDAAAVLYQAILGDPHVYGEIVLGEADHSCWVQAFARHRTRPSSTETRLREAERFYVDCEFDGHGGEMLSMAVVREDGRGLYLCIADKPDLLDEWVEANVWPLVHLRLPVGKTVAFVEDWGHFIRPFIGELNSPTIIADSPVDIWRFCEAVSTGPSGAWECVNNPRLTFEVHNVDCWPNDLVGGVQHNAYWDAMALRSALTATGNVS